MGRPRQFDSESAVERAMQVFWRKGYGATTPQDLVDELGIGKGSLYNAFGSKHALFEKALLRYRESQTEALIAMLAEEGTVKERLRKALTFLVELDLSDPDRRGCMAVNTTAELGGSDEAAMRLIRGMLDRTEDAFQALVAEGQRAGEIAADRDAKAVGSLLLNTVIGLRVICRTAEGPERPTRIVEGLLASL